MFINVFCKHFNRMTLRCMCPEVKKVWWFFRPMCQEYGGFRMDCEIAERPSRPPPPPVRTPPPSTRVDLYVHRE